MHGAQRVKFTYLNFEDVDPNGAYATVIRAWRDGRISSPAFMVDGSLITHGQLAVTLYSQEVERRLSMRRL